MQSKRSDSIDSATAAASGAVAKQLSNSSFSELHLHQLCLEEPWHMELRIAFVTLYMQYLQQPGAGFQQIQVLPAASDASASQRYVCLCYHANGGNVFTLLVMTDISKLSESYLVNHQLIGSNPNNSMSSASFFLSLCHFHQPGLTAIYQTTLHTTSINFVFQF